MAELLRWPLAVVLSCIVLGAADTQPAPEGTPVLVELFTSEGCSSCPPADNLLVQLDRQQPVPGVHIIVMGEHVDYWNREGWVDQFSSPEFSLRQRAYVERLKVSDAYTPEVVVDGSRECLGSNPDAVEAAIRAAAHTPKLGLTIVPGKTPDSVSIDVQGASAARGAYLYAVFAQNEAETNVLRGENQGHVLHHVAIVRKVRKLGKLGKDDQDFHIQFSVASHGGQRLIAFVQQSDIGKVLGAAEYPIPK